jgi:hypothetical protein
MVLSQKNVKAKIMVSSGPILNIRRISTTFYFFFNKVVLDPKNKGIQEAPKMRTKHFFKFPVATHQLL